MPALNEANNIGPSIEMVQEVFRRTAIPYELIIVNDGSQDTTGNIATAYAREDPCIQLVHHHEPQGMGACYKVALGMTKTRHFLLVVSKNECALESIEKLVVNRAEADMIIPYTVNANERGFSRRVISSLYTILVNLITGYNLKYYNGTILHRTCLLQSIKMESNGHSFQSEAVIRLIREGHSYKEVPITVNWNKAHKTNAFKIKNVIDVASFLRKILMERLFSQ